MIEYRDRTLEYHPKRLIEAGLTKRHINTSIDDPRIQGFEYVQLIRNYVSRLYDYCQEGKGLLLYGPYGTGKTALSAYVIKECLGRGGLALFVKAAEIPSLCIENPPVYPDDSVRYVEHFHKVDLLVVDNLNSDLISGWSATKFEDIIRERYNRMKPTVITTNVNLTDLDQIITSGTLSLIQSVCFPILVDGVQWRDTCNINELRAQNESRS